MTTVNELVEEFASVVTKAESAKEQGQGTKVIGIKMAGVVDAIRTGDLSALPESVKAERLQTLASELERLSGALRGQSGDSDREAGDTLATRAQAALDSGLVDDTNATTLNDLISRYKAARVTFRKRTGEHASKDLGFKIKVIHEGTGKEVATTRKDNPDGFRSQVHAWYKVNVSNGEKLSKESLDGLMAAIKSVMEGKSNNAQGAGFLVDRVAESGQQAA